MNSNDHEKEKIVLENRKLGLEIERLKRPFYKQPGILIGIITAIAAIGGIYVQYIFSSHKYDLAKVESQTAELIKERAENEKKEAEKRRDGALDELAGARNDVQNLEAERSRLVEAKEELKQDIVKAQETKGNLLKLIAELRPQTEVVTPIGETVTFVGLISDREGRPIRGAQVKAYQEARLIYNERTPLHGQFKIEAQRGKTVRFVVEKSGFFTSAESRYATSDEIINIVLIDVQATMLK